MTLDDIKQAVNDGQTVCWSNIAYTVIKDDRDQWLIECCLNGHCIGLTWDDGVTLNGKPEQFFIA